MGQPEHPDRAKIEEYRAKGVVAAEIAASTKDAFIRSSYEQMSEAYHEMAERLERRLNL